MSDIANEKQKEALRAPNLTTEFRCERCVGFRGSIDTNDIVQKKMMKEEIR